MKRVLLVILGLLFCAPMKAQSDEEDARLKQVGEAFLQAEAGELIKDYLNRHPPVEGVEGFGSASLFAVQMVLAADSYLKAHNDQQRFAAVRSGAAAYVAYSYAATPAVGIIVTAVYLCTQVVEQGVASDYQAEMLRIYKEMQQVQLRINDLNARLGIAEAKRFMVLADGAVSCFEEGLVVERQLSTQCASRPASFREAGQCFILVLKAISVREEQLRWLNKLASASDSLLAMLNLDRSGAGSAESANAAEYPSTPELIKERAIKNRERIAEISKKVEEQLKALRKLSGSAEEMFVKIAASLFVDEAVEDSQRKAALRHLKMECQMDSEALASGALSVIARSGALKVRWRQLGETTDNRVEMSSIRSAARRIRESYQQRRIAFPDIAANQELSKLMDMLVDPLSDLLIQ